MVFVLVFDYEHEFVCKRRVRLQWRGGVRAFGDGTMVLRGRRGLSGVWHENGDTTFIFLFVWEILKSQGVLFSALEGSLDVVTVCLLLAMHTNNMCVFFPPPEIVKICEMLLVGGFFPLCLHLLRARWYFL
jgi:hypothetical protein